MDWAENCKKKIIPQKIDKKRRRTNHLNKVLIAQIELYGSIRT
jgi:hypothetical protein